LPNLNSPEIRAILLDIEGATTPIDFVFKTLFPFAGLHAEEFLRRHFDEPEVKDNVEELRRTWSGSAANGAPVWIESTHDEKMASVARYVRWLIARDSKITPLKALQGKIWEEGFLRGELKGEVYPDVAPAFARWKSQGRRMAIFSSGSMLAQKLLFSLSTAGDLSSFIEAYFDTSAGPKREAQSYKKIAAALELVPEQLVFISDVGAELDAAHEAHLHTAHSLRPGVTPLPGSAHPAIHTFAEIFP
jgi:enolase-phosphatase E1